MREKLYRLGFIQCWKCVPHKYAFNHSLVVDYKICDMIKGNASDVGNIDFELQAKIGD